LFILNINTKAHFYYEIDKLIFDKIFTFRFVSKSDTDFICLVACQKTNLKQILIFDINEDHNEGKTKILNHQHEANELTKVAISVDFKQIVFVNKTENFEIMDMGTYYV
jgi:hypothetical protein